MHMCITNMAYIYIHSPMEDVFMHLMCNLKIFFLFLSLFLSLFIIFWQIETIFKGQACNEIRESALGLTKRLAQTAQETFGDFEEAVEKDATKTAVSDGTVHPLTSYVINYVKFLFE